MTDRGVSALRQSRESFTVGPSSMRWQDGCLTIEVDEISAPPLVSRMRGTITLVPTGVTEIEAALTPDGSHVWRPFAPTCDIRVDLEAKGWQWNGHGYFDANFGTRALEQDFDYWTWGRFPLGDGSTCFYDAEMRDGSRLSLGAHFGPDGTVSEVTPPPEAPLPRSLWAVARKTRADANSTPRNVQTMLDAPFYTRATIGTTINGEDSVGVHEALDLRRFRSPFVKPLLACRVPRRAHWRF